jgi:hypothetical protein
MLLTYIFTFSAHPVVILFIPVSQWGVSVFRFGNENRCDVA